MEKWTGLLAQGYHDIAQLQGILSLTDSEVESLKPVQDKYPLFVNPYYLSLIDSFNPEDPIRKMCIPSIQELDVDGSIDTSGEKSNTVLPGLQHKYEQTALVLSTNQCAMYCRHCFRRRMVGVSNDETVADIYKIAGYIRCHKEITNVLISGGDAFMNSNDTIEKFLSLLCCIPHLDCIRFGTRTPVVLPQRITTDYELRDILEKYGKKKRLYVITQFNHSNEITTSSKEAVSVLLRMGIPVRNQTVLLKGINDNVHVLSNLLRKLTMIGVIPYYVFQCRPVIGIKNHFQIPLKTGYKIVDQTMNLQNGLGKSFRYMMSHVTGKIEILGITGDQRMLFKFHQAKSPAHKGRIFEQMVSDTQCWL